MVFDTQTGAPRHSAAKRSHFKVLALLAWFTPEPISWGDQKKPENGAESLFLGWRKSLDPR